MKNVSEILALKEKTLDEVAELVKMTPRDVLGLLIEKERASTEVITPAADVESAQVSKAPTDERTDDQLANYFLNRLEKESLSITALNNKYKVHDEERVERILENMLREGKLTKRESRNKKGRFVYEAAKK
ncbi:MAG: hypothetical protein HXS48_24025 [Theionarchaea archaeon]|nr:MAG: hypothetical protein AYK19_12925 [Theionarchaea archaeon DG-70-1]MBU7030021.1 hypothetical protein [Theionarchaea archaeon]